MAITLGTAAAGAAFAVSVTCTLLVMGGTFHGGADGGFFLVGVGMTRTYITPDSSTLFIWFLSMLWDLVFVVGLFVPLVGPLADLLAVKTFGLNVQWRAAVAFSLHTCWVLLYTYEYYTVSLIVVVGHVATLVSLHITVNTTTVQNLCGYVVFAAPIAVKASWIFVVCGVNFFMCAVEYGWTTSTIAGPPEFAVVAVVACAAVGCFVGFVSLEPLWPLVQVWVFWGILRAASAGKAMGVDDNNMVHFALMISITWTCVTTVGSFCLVAYAGCAASTAQSGVYMSAANPAAYKMTA